LRTACPPTWWWTTRAPRQGRKDLGPAGQDLNPKVGNDHVAIMRGLEDSSVGFLWIQVTNPFQSSPNANHWNKAAREKDNFIVVADVYPTISGKVADLILPAAYMLEKWGLYGNAERRTQAWRQQVDPPGEARTDVWMMLEFSKRFKLRDVWGESPARPEGRRLPGQQAAQRAGRCGRMGYTPDSTLYDVLFARPESKKVAWPDPIAKGHANATVKALGETGSRKRRCSTNTGSSPSTTSTTWHRLTCTTATRCAACAGR
jgi:nitrate reductase NapA